MIAALFAVLLTLILVVGVHEAGHALVASWFGVKIKKISIGFGSPIFQWRGKKGSAWIWALWPLGGYVELLNSRIHPVTPDEYPHCFDKKPVAQRIAILLAGAVANIITAWVAFFIVFNVGIVQTSPKIQTVTLDSIAARAGLVAGDRWVSIAGRATNSWQDAGKQLLMSWGLKEVPAVIAPANSTQSKNIIMDMGRVKFTAHDRSLFAVLGFSPDLFAEQIKVQAPTILDGARQAANALLDYLIFFVIVIKHLISGAIPFSLLLGPIGIFAVSLNSFLQGITVFLNFIAGFSVAVALVNLLPVPGLDGASIGYCVMEKIRRKPLSIAMEILLYRLVFIAFCILLVQLFANDLTRIYARPS